MISTLVKKVLSEQRIEQVRRFKNLQRSSIHALKEKKIIPGVTIQIGSTSFEVTYISEIPMLQWKKIVSDYASLPTTSEKEEAVASLAHAICREPQFLDIISQPYLRNIISNDELYNALYGTALYVNGKIKEAFEIFKRLSTAVPIVENYLLAYRAAVMLDDKEKTAIDHLREALRKFPDDPILKLCEASTYYRNFETAKANEILNALPTQFKERLMHYNIAGTSSKHLKEFEEELATAISQKLIERPKAEHGKIGDTYSEENVGEYWNQLYYAFNFFNRFQHGWGNLAFMIENIIQQIINEYPDIRQVVDFGTFCANPLYKLSKNYPQVNFFGVDREQATKKFNDAAFSNPNLKFIAGQIIDVLPTIKTNNQSLLFHSRTATLIYPEQMKRIYKACATNGVKYIATYENFALSRTHLNYFDFNNMPAEAITYGSVMMIHNYPAYMQEAGYEIVSEKRFTYADLFWKGSEELLGDAHGCVLARLK